MHIRARVYHAFVSFFRPAAIIGVVASTLAMPDRVDAGNAVGALPGNFSVGKQGEATYRIPIDIPPGVNSLTPDLALGYNSQSGDGIAGVRWSLSGLSAISRCGMTFAQDGQSDPVDFDANDKWCLDGQRLLVTNGMSYGEPGSKYHTEIESFQEVRAYGQVEGVPKYFRVRSKDGLIKWYGSSGDSRVELQGTDKPRTWAVKRIEDRFGNFIRFEYEEKTRAGELGEHRIDRITYGNNNGVAVGKVDFDYEPRSNMRIGYQFGGKVSRTKRLMKIHVRSHSGYAHTYHLKYREDPVSTSSELTAVKKCKGVDDDLITVNCLPATRFTWLDGNPGFNTNSEKTVLESGQHEKLTIADYDGDGFNDFAFVEDGQWKIIWGDTKRKVPTDISDRNKRAPLVADYDGDGKADFWIPTLRENDSTTEDGETTWSGSTSGGDTVPTYNISWRIYLGSDKGFVSENVVYPVQFDVLWPDKFGGYTTADVDNDLRPDLVMKVDGFITVLRSGNGYATLGAKTDLEVVASQKISPMNFNGDGQVDFFVSRGQCAVGSDPDGGGSSDGDGPFDTGLRDWELAKVGFSKQSTQSAKSLSESEPCLDSSGLVINQDGTLKKTTLNAAEFGQSYPVDFNNDGLSDVLYSSPNGFELYINRGGKKGLTETSVGSYPEIDTGSLNVVHPGAIKFVDYEQDGDTDFIYRWDGKWMLATIDLGASNAISVTTIDLPGLLGDNQSPAEVAIMSLDGLPSPGIFSWAGQGLSGYLMGTAHVGLINSIENGLGHKTTVDYKSLTGRVGASIYEPSPDDTYGQMSMPDLESDPDHVPFVRPMQVVSNFSQDSGLANESVTSTYYAYAGGVLNTKGRGFLGFRRVDALNVNTGTYTRNVHSVKFPHAGMVEYTVTRKPDVAPEPVFRDAKESLDKESLCLGDDGETNLCSQLLMDAQERVKQYNPMLSSYELSLTPKVSEAHHELAAFPVEGGGVFPFVKKSNVRRFEATGANRVLSREVTEYEYDDQQALPDSPLPVSTVRGNVTRTVQTTDDGRDGTPDTVEVSTDNTYADDAGNWCLGRLVSTAVNKSGPSGLASQRDATFSYTNGTCVLESETEESVVVTTDDGTISSGTLTRTYRRDSFGNVIAKTVSGTGIQPRTTQSVYDGLGLHVVRSINPLGHEATTLWHDIFGKKVSDTGPNGLTSEFAYDDFGRLEVTKTPRSKAVGRTFASKTARHWCGSGPVPCRSSEAVYQVLEYDGFVTGTDQLVARTEYDQVGREVATLSRDLDGQWVIQKTKFDILGRKEATSDKHHTGKAGCWTWREFDVVSRVVATYSPAEGAGCTDLPPDEAGSYVRQTVAYNQASDLSEAQGGTTATVATTRRVTDPEGRQKLVGSDAQGNKIVTIEYSDKGSLVSTFAYDAEGNLARAEVDGEAPVEMYYDGRGNKVSMVDPDMGAWSYTYNVLGQLTEQEGPDGKTVTLTYDKLGRKTTRTEQIRIGTGEAGSTDEFQEMTTQWVYDVGYGAGIGKLAYVQRPDGYVKAFAYNAFGQTTDTIRRVDDEVYWVSQTYDAFGRPDVTVYPDVEAVATGSDNPGTTQLDACLGKKDPNPSDDQVPCAGPGEVALSWMPVEGAVQYRLYRAPVVDGSATQPATPIHESMIAATDSEPYKDRPGRDGTYRYWLEVCATDSAGNCADPSTADVTVDAPVPVPGQLAVPGQSATGDYGIEWARIPGDIVDPTEADGISYTLQEAPSETGTWKSVCNTAEPQCRFSGQDEGEYYYRVRAERDDDVSAWSEPSGKLLVQFKPQLSNLSIAADPVRDGKDANGFPKPEPAGGTLSWTTSHDWADYFEVREYREGTAKPGEPTATTRHKTFPLPEHTTGKWIYAVRACHRAKSYNDGVTETSHCGDERTVKRQLAPAAPTVSSDGDSDHDGRLELTLSPGPEGDTEHYSIYRRHTPFGASSAGDWIKLEPSTPVDMSNPEDTYHSDQLENGDYKYRVRACNTVNGTQCSDYSGTGVMPVIIRPAPPEALTVSPAMPEVSTDGNYFLDWTVSLEDDRDEYRLERRGPGETSWTAVPAFDPDLNCDLNAGGTRDNEPDCEPVNYSSDGTTASNSRSLSVDAEGIHEHRFAVCHRDVCSNFRRADLEVLYVPTKPGAIRAPTTKQYDGEYEVSWVAADGKNVTYRLYEGDRDLSPKSKVYEGKATSFTVEDRSDGYYRYEVKACNRAGCGPMRTRSDGVHVLRPPSRPGSVTLPTSSTSTGVGFDFEAASGYEPVYEAYVSTQSDFSGQRAALVEKDTSLCDSQLEPDPSCYETAPQLTQGRFHAEADGNHYVRVRACNEAGCGPYRAADNAVNVATTPDRPSSISSPNWDGNGAYTISWGTASGGDLKAYELQEATSSDFSDASRIYRGTGTSKSVSGRGDRRYYYRVRACGPFSCSGWESTSTRVYLRPGKPGSLSFPYKNRDRKYTVKWGSASGSVTNYRLAESRNGGSWRRVYKGSNTRKYFGDKADGNYRYRVRACNGPSCSGWRYGDHKLRNYEPPGRPGWISASTDSVYAGTDYSVSWGTASGTVTRYQLYEGTGDFSSQERIYNGSGRSKYNIARGTGDYYYRARTCNPAGCGPYRGTANVKVMTDQFYCGTYCAQRDDHAPDTPENPNNPALIAELDKAEPASAVAQSADAAGRANATTVSARTTAGNNRQASTAHATSGRAVAGNRDDRFVAYPAPDPVEPLRDNAYLQQRHDARTNSAPMPGDMEARPASTGNHPDNGEVAPHMVRREYDQWGNLIEVHELTESNGDYVAGEVYWQAREANARGQMMAEKLGNGLVDYRQYDEATGRLELRRVHPDDTSGTVLMSTAYEWSKVGNLKSRNDLVNDWQERFEYDALDRLTYSEKTVGGVTGTGTSYAYDQYGNLKQKGQARQNYQYAGKRPHAVTSVEVHDNGSLQETTQFTYDAKGSVLTAGGRSVSWTSFNKPRDIENGLYNSRFWYGPGRGRYKQLANTSEGTVETVYVGGLYKKITKIADSGSTEVTHRHFIQAGGRTVAVYDRTFDVTADTASEDTRYWHRDHHGSIVMTTQGPNTKGEAIGAVVMRTGFKAWGGRRGVPGMDQDSALYWAGHGELSSKTVTRNGYTGHEHMDELGLIHMNGRVYDPELGRFLSADPHVQAPTASQSYNRYAYVLNNPLRYSDPSGYFWKELYEVSSPGTKRAMENDTLHGIGKAALNFVPYCQVWCAAVAEGIRGYMLTGSESAAWESAAYTAASGAVAYGVGQMGGLNQFEAAVLHGVSQGAIASAQGGDFGTAFASAFVSHAVGPEISGSDAASTVKIAILGGTVSKIAGGSFANGAVTAAFVHVLNCMKHTCPSLPNEDAVGHEEPSQDYGTERRFEPGEVFGEWDAGQGVTYYSQASEETFWEVDSDTGPRIGIYPQTDTGNVPIYLRKGRQYLNVLDVDIDPVTVGEFALHKEYVYVRRWRVSNSSPLSHTLTSGPEKAWTGRYVWRPNGNVIERGMDINVYLGKDFVKWAE